MRINLDEINRNDFRVEERFLDGIGKVYLIVPTFTKHKWSSEDRHLRSLLLDENFKVCSASLMKFHNFGEVPELDLLTEQAIRDGQAYYPSKMDGSLLIRSVIEGQVHFRTRGSHTLVDQFETNVMGLVREKYPRLLDPALDARYSILFEYIGPENQIVVKYDESSLVVLGLMDLSAEPPEFVSSPDIVLELQETYGTPGVQFHKLDGSLQEITEQVRGWNGVEGIVIWSTLPNGKMLLSKVKSAEYIRIHTLKFQMNETRVFQFCWYRDITTLDQLKDHLFQLGVDWEGVSFLAPVFEAYAQKRSETIQLVSNFIQQIENNNLRSASRKDAAIALKEMTKENSILFNVGIDYLFKDGNIQRQIDAITLGIPVKQLDNFRKEAAEQEEYFKSRSDTDE